MVNISFICIDGRSYILPPANMIGLKRDVFGPMPVAIKKPAPGKRS